MKNIYYFYGIGELFARNIGFEEMKLLFCGIGTLAFDYFVVHFCYFQLPGNRFDEHATATMYFLCWRLLVKLRSYYESECCLFVSVLKLKPLRRGHFMA